MRQRLLGLAITALVLYGVAPAVLEVFGAFDQLNRIQPWWWAAVVVTQAAGILCFSEVQRLALHTRDWFAVITSNLASGALGRVIPGGAASAAALQYQMLVRGSVNPATAATGLTAGSLLLLATLAALPILALPALVGGHVPRTLLTATLMGLVLFVALFALGFVLMRSDKAVLRIGRAGVWVLRKVRRRKPAPENLPAKLLQQRDLIRATLGDHWPMALAAAAGRWLFDFLTLQAALAAVGAHPNLALALLAYCAAQLLAQFPLTPGGLGIVEAGMTGTLALIGVSAGAAALATLTYRLGSYWLQLPAGLVAWILHRRRYGAAAAQVASPPS
ncbi:MAG: putative heme transporter [Thermoleophilaceae bacterium]|jgi:uncharacterized protein (TIRG00374 family)|nr:putative heme transporter [Thermoleophilaceae bacterium]